MWPSFDALVNQCIHQFDHALRAITGNTPAQQTSPAANTALPALSAEQRMLSIALMRVDHVGEVCAQALYQAQALATPNSQLKTHFQHAAAEEREHLAWTAERLHQLGGRPSLLNPLWYAGAFALGLVAGRLGDRTSLGFVVQTEKLVEAHLDEHLQRLPEADHASRAILQQMKDDEIRHAASAQQAGAAEIPQLLKCLMASMGKVMTRTAERI